MASPVVSALASISTAWEAATPPDRVNVTYHRVEGRGRRTGTAGDRTFYFGRPRQDEIALQSGSARSVQWEVPAVVRLSQAGRSDLAMTSATINETALLEGAISTTTSWPAGVIEVSVIDVETETDGDDGKGDTLLNFTLRLWAEETD